jgi:hypothetical protein
MESPLTLTHPAHIRLGGMMWLVLHAPFGWWITGHYAHFEVMVRSTFPSWFR